MATATFGATYNGEGSQPKAVKEALTYTAGYIIIVDEAFGVVTNQLLTIALPITGLKGIIAWCEAQNVTVKTNSSGSPIQTLAFLADTVGWLWTVSSPMACPITTAITALYFTTTVTGGTFRLRALYNL